MMSRGLGGLNPRGENVDLTLATNEVDGATIIAVGGEIDVYTAPKLRDKITELVADGVYDIIVDMEAVEFLDSTGLGVLVGGLKKVRAHDGSLAADLHPGPAAQDLPDHRAGQGVRHPRLRRRSPRRPLSPRRRSRAPVTPDAAIGRAMRRLRHVPRTGSPSLPVTAGAACRAHTLIRMEETA